MQRAKSQTGFYTKQIYEVPGDTNERAKNWEQNHMYETSYFRMSMKNVSSKIL